MGKKDSKTAKAAKKARTAEKAAKAKAKGDSKNKKLAAKSGEEEDVDLDEMLAEFARQQTEFEKVTISLSDRPSKRQNVSLVANPLQGKHELFLFGGEATSSSYSHFYNDLFVYSIKTDQWRKITSPNTPMPRSSHAMCAHPSGIMLMFGGEFSSPKQSTFYHYGDTWVLDPASKEWTKIETKKQPSSRSGHRMTVWKNYILLHGGFRDLSASTTYLDDLWAFDVTDYRWHQIELPQTMSIPDARSGHSFVPCAEGAIVWGGYSKVKASKGLQKGKVHVDGWLLKMKSDLKGVRWERRKKGGFAPSPRIGCYMVPHQGRGILFGGVYDTQETEESLTSQFYNTLYSYNIETNRWLSMGLRSRKRRQEPVAPTRERRDDDLQQNLSNILQNLNIDIKDMLDDENELEDEEEDEPVEKKEYPIVSQLPHPRFNTTTAVADNQLFIFGGLWEDGDREFAFDSFYSIDLGKLDGVKVYWENLGLDEAADSDEDDDDDDEDEDDDDEPEEDAALESEDEDEEEEEEEPIEEEDPDPRPWLPHPKPFQTLTAFYRANINQFVEWALKVDHDARAKELKRIAFELCEARWWERRDAIRAAEDDFEEMGGVDEVVERTAERTSRR